VAQYTAFDIDPKVVNIILKDERFLRNESCMVPYSKRFKLLSLSYVAIDLAVGVKMN
jgi:hypothetical protein